MRAVSRASHEGLTEFETSCFNGVYATGDISDEYLARIENQRGSSSDNDGSSREVDLNLGVAEQNLAT